MKIVQVSAEFAPIAKAGGLAEVAVGLSRELVRLGHRVEVMMPKYDFIDMGALKGVHIEVPNFKCMEKGNAYGNAMWAAEAEGVSLRLLEARHPAGYFHRGKIYGCQDDTARFLYFSRAVVEYLKVKGGEIDVLQLHDWHVAMAAVFARDVFKLGVKCIVLTIHNAAYQGKCATWDLDYIGLKSADYLKKMQDDLNPKLINILKGGLEYADAIVAVSPTYAKEILTKAEGFGLEHVFQRMKGKLFGILNGLDLDLWNPKKDRYLSAKFDGSIEVAKGKNREALAKRMGISANARPWVGAITRLASQKGPELIEAAIHETLKMGGAFILLGSEPNAKILAGLEVLKKEYRGKPVFIHLGHQDSLAHELYAALDFLVLPSLYEPCGLSQMIAMRYGTVPIARATGGHIDTIFEDPKRQNGFLFPDYTKESVTKCLERAIRIWKDKPDQMHTIIKNGLAMDWSWNKSAKEYIVVYSKCVRNDRAINKTAASA